MKNTIPNSQSTFCKHCHIELPVSASFCSACGTNVVHDALVENGVTEKKQEWQTIVSPKDFFSPFADTDKQEDDDITARLHSITQESDTDEQEDNDVTIRLDSISQALIDSISSASSHTKRDEDNVITTRHVPISQSLISQVSIPSSPSEKGEELEVTIVEPVVNDQQSETQPTLLHRIQHRIAHLPISVVLIAVGLVTFLVQGYHLSSAPDIFSDEAVYLLVGTSIVKGLGITVDNSIFLWHPPVYMLVEAIYIKLAGLTSTNSLSAVLLVRYLNVFFSACTAALLVLFGRKLHSYKAGLFMALLFILDPYVQRINRRNMLETLAMLCVLLGLYIFFTYRPHLTTRQRIAAGIAFGIALLTKEPMVLELLTLILYVVVFRRSQLRDMLWVATIAVVLYLLYPLGIALYGQWGAYLSYKIFNLARIPAALVDRQPPPPVSTITLAPDAKDYLLNSLWNRFGQYGTSYLLIVFAAIFMIMLGLRYRRQTAARYLVMRGAFSFVFGLLLGRVSDQYFYYLIVPSIIISGYMLALLVDKVRSPSIKKVPFFERRQPNFPSLPTYRTLWRPIFAIFAIILLYNSFMWINTYVVQSDNAYVHVIQYVETHIPADASIESSDDVPVYYLPSSYTILRDRNTRSLEDNHAR